MEKCHFCGDSRESYMDGEGHWCSLPGSNSPFPVCWVCMIGPKIPCSPLEIEGVTIYKGEDPPKRYLSDEFYRDFAKSQSDSTAGSND